MKDNRRRRSGKPRVSSSLLDRINPHAAGIDCGSAEHFVAVPPDRDPSPVQSFKTFTSDLFIAMGVLSVAIGAFSLVVQRNYRRTCARSPPIHKPFATTGE